MCERITASGSALDPSDPRGFLLSETHPESGTTTYSQVDARGKATRQASAAGITLRTSYDAAERVTQVEDVSSATTTYPLLEYLYATSNTTGNRRRGKLETAIGHSHIAIPWNPGIEVDIEVRETYVYGGKYGRVSRRDTQVEDFVLAEGPPRSFTQSWTWDALGNPVATTYPRCTHGVCAPTAGPPRTVASTYLQGRLKTVAGVVDNMTYHANGLVARVDRSNGTADVITPDPAGHPRPYTLDVVGPWGTSGLGEHLYDGSGNLVQVGFGTDNRYHYDGVGRLIRFGLDSGQWQEYDYDPYGNLTTLRHHDGSTTTTRTFAVNTTTNRLSVAGYDADGNLLAWADETYAWDALGRMKHHTCLVQDGPDEVYAYTADGERILALEYRPGEPVRETWTLRDLDGKLLTTYVMEGTNEVGDWQWQKDHAYRGDTLVMAWTPEPYPDDRHYYSVDHLGTPRLVTDAAGNVESVHHYFGFGEELNTTTTAETKRFTGHERDFHTPGSRDDLDYMHARYYKAHMGRFLTVDPVGGRPEAPGSWNRYAYALGNPVRYTDPNGEDAWDTLNGFANAIGANFLLGATRVEPHNEDFARGQEAGDKASALLALLEISQGSQLVAGAAACEAVTLGGCTPAAVPGAAAGVTVVIHGFGMLTVATQNHMESRATNEKGGGKTGRKANSDRKNAAKQKIEELKEAKRNAKTKKERREIQKQITHWRRQMENSEEHARTAQGNR